LRKWRRHKMQDRNSVEIHYKEEYPLIQCPYCQMSFILIAIIENGTDNSANWMKQAWADFCPYCGRKLPKKED